MNLKDLVAIETKVKAKFVLGLEELHLLSYIQSLWDTDEVTIMLLLDKYKHWASPATTHKRVDDLIRSEILEKVVSVSDARIKTLVEGRKFNDLVKLLKEF